MNKYDRIIKENIVALLEPLTERLLGIEVARVEPVETDKLQVTIEREPDFLRQIVDKEGDKFILHLEFQTEDKEMLYRMAEYKAIVQRKFELPVRQYVLYFGRGKAKMQTELPLQEQITGFELRNMSSLNVNDLLQSDVPEEILLALFADFPETDTEVVLHQIVLNLRRASDNKAAFRKYLQQLVTLSRMHKLDIFAKKIVETMPITLEYDVTEDAFYKEGEAKGEARGEARGVARGERSKAKEVVINLLQANRFTIEEIAAFCKTSTSFVEEVKLELEKGL